MIVHVIPVKRMPRTLGLLSYTVPTDLQQTIRTGQLIIMPLRSSIIYGLVFSIDEKTNDDLKPIESIVYEAPLLTPAILRRIDMLARIYGVSHGTASTLFTPPLQKRKLAKEAWSTPESIVSKAQQKKLQLLSTTADAHTCIEAINSGTLVIAPQISDIDEIETKLPKDLRTIVWHSELSVKEKFARWFLVQRGEYDVIIGTRTSLFLPIEHVAQVIVWQEQDTSHKQWEGHPRYAVHDLLDLWGSQFTSTITYTTHSPRFDTYYHVAKGIIEAEAHILETLHTPLARPQIVSMLDERKGGNKDIIAASVLQQIQEATNHVALYVNRKGYATAVGCNDCTYVSRCDHCNMPHVYYASTKTLRCHYCKTTQRVPLSCPDCNSTEIAPFGIGTEQVTEYIQTAIPNKQVIRIDSDVETLPAVPAEPSIFVGTDRMLSWLPWDTIGIAALVNIDEPLNYPDYRAMESVWHTIKRFDTLLPSDAMLQIQTNNPDHLVLRSLREPERLYRTDLSARKEFHMPPYGMLVRLNGSGATEFAAEKEAERVYSMLERTLTDKRLSATLTYPIPTSPTFYRGKYWYTILAKLDKENWKQDLSVLLQHLPSNWKVDVSPQSLLSP